MILCHVCGLLFAPVGRGGSRTLVAARDHAFTAHPDRFGDCTFTDVLSRPTALLEETS